MRQARWRNVLRYAHCDPLDDATPWDGVALLWYRSEAARLAHLGDDAARATMRADEAETFARPVRGFSTLVEETRLAGGAGAGALKRFVFLWRAPGLSRLAFQAWWLREHAPWRLAVLGALPGFAGLTFNAARDEAALAGFGLDCDAIEESDWTARAAAPDGDAPPVARIETLWCREVVLSEAGAQANSERIS